jgi:tetratricopeptide (TPR) repeat protein
VSAFLIALLLLQVAPPAEAAGDRASAYREYLLARLAVFDNRTEAAAAHLARAHKLDPGSAQVLAAQAQVDLRRGQLGEAAERAREATGLDPDCAEGWATLSRALAIGARGRPDRMGEAIEAQLQVLRIDPKDTAQRLVLARWYLEAERLEEAAAALDAAGAGGPGAGQVGARLIELLLRQGRVEEAMERVEPTLANLQGDTRGLRTMVRLLRAHDRNEEALEAMRLLRHGAPLDPDDEADLVELLMLVGEVDRAAEAAAEAWPVFPEHARLAAVSGQALRRAGLPAEAAEAYERAVIADPADLYSRRGLVAMLLFLDRRDDAVFELLEGARAVQSQTPRAAATLRVQAADLLLEAGRPEDCLAALEKGTRVRELLLERETIRGQALARVGRRKQALEIPGALARLGAYPRRALLVTEALIRYEAEGEERTRSWLRREVEEDPAPPGLALAASRFWLGLDRLDEAEALLEAVERGGSGSPEVFVELSNIRLETGRPEEAVGALRAALELRPDLPLALNNLAYVLAEGPGPFEEAVALAERAVDADPENVAYLDTLGWALHRAGRNEEALAALRLAVAAGGGGDPVIREHLGDVHLVLGDPEEAALSYGRALGLRPESPERLRGKLAGLGEPAP